MQESQRATDAEKNPRPCKKHLPEVLPRPNKQICSQTNPDTFFNRSGTCRGVINGTLDKNDVVQRFFHLEALMGSNQHLDASMGSPEERRKNLRVYDELPSINL